MIHNNKVYANADEKFVKNTIIYVDSLHSGYPYYDPEMTKPVYNDDMVELYLNGVLLCEKLSDSEVHYITVTYVTPSGPNGTWEYSTTGELTVNGYIPEE